MALLIGITFAVLLMIQMLSASALSPSPANVIRIGASLWIMDAAVDTFANLIPMQVLQLFSEL